MIGEWAEKQGHSVASTKLYESAPLPAMEAFDWLAVMGGPMSTDEEGRYPWLADEKDFLKAAIDAQKPIIGVCLGAQLLSEALGGSVAPNQETEIGWFPVALTEEGRKSPFTRRWPQEFTAFHWHGDTFDIPKRAVRLASSTACRNQAFAWRDRVVGLQFHLEYTPDSIRAMLEHCGDEIYSAPYIQCAPAIETQIDLTRDLRPMLYQLLDALVSGREIAPQASRLSGRLQEPRSI